MSVPAYLVICDMYARIRVHHVTVLDEGGHYLLWLSYLSRSYLSVSGVL